LDDGSLASILLLPNGTQECGRWHWLVLPKPAERDCIALLCKVNQARDRVCGYYRFPKMEVTFADRMSAILGLLEQYG
jgi:hypothetical protein